MNNDNSGIIISLSVLLLVVVWFPYDPPFKATPVDIDFARSVCKGGEWESIDRSEAICKDGAIYKREEKQL